MKPKNRTSKIKLVKLFYALAWIAVFGVIAVASISPAPQTEIQSDIPQLDTDNLAKILGGLSERKAAPLSEPFDFGTIKYGKTEPFK
jgi:hypothetical protein